MTTQRVALVTGGNRGIGRAVAARLCRRGLRVVIGGRDLEHARQVAGHLGGDVRAVQLDVTDAASIADAHKLIGPVDVLINNAGVLLDMGHDPLTVPLELVEQQLSVNALGAWRVSQTFVPDMVRRGWGRVVTVSSGTGAFSNGLFAGAPGYSASKTLLNAATVLLAGAVEGTGVLVNAVNPGLVSTRMRPDAPRSAEDAAADVEYAAMLPDDGPTGTFLRGHRTIPW